jgi:hypothetical protein
MSKGLKNIRKDILRGFRNYLIRSNRYVPLYLVNCQTYRLLEYFIRKLYSSVPGVKSIYLAHGLALGELYPGLSDFDLVIIFESSRSQEFYINLRSRWKVIQRFLSARDILLFTEQEFTLWQKIGGGWEPLDELRHWKLIYGHELRQSDWNLNSQQAKRDRLRYVLAKYHGLLYSAIKEEPKSPYLAISARRNLYKFFCYSILPLQCKYLSIGNQYERLSQWIEDSKINGSRVHELLKMGENRFQSGEISNLKFSIGALGCKIIDDALESFSYRYTPMSNGIPRDEMSIPLYNLREVEERMRGLSSNIVELLNEKIASIMLMSNGSAVGYMFFIILRDDLTIDQVEETLRILHVIFRIYDDPWFNEYFPAKVPIVYSKSMFLTHFQVWPFDKNFAHLHRRVLYGKDLYQELMENPPITNYEDNLEEEIMREKLNLSRFLHQIYLEKLKPALYEATTLHFPRLYIAHKAGWTPTTTEEALFYYEKLADTKAINYPKAFVEKYGRKNIHELEYAMSDDEFERVYAFLRDEMESS